MIKSSLSQFVDRVSQNKHIAPDDVKVLLRSVLEDGLISREEAETLLALDRTFDAHESWGDALVTLVVDYVVWGARPTGSVTPRMHVGLPPRSSSTGRPRPGCGSPTRSSRKRRPRTRRWSISSCADISWRRRPSRRKTVDPVSDAMLECACPECFPSRNAGSAFPQFKCTNVPASRTRPGAVTGEQGFLLALGGSVERGGGSRSYEAHNGGT